MKNGIITDNFNDEQKTRFSELIRNTGIDINSIRAIVTESSVTITINEKKREYIIQNNDNRFPNTKPGLAQATNDDWPNTFLEDLEDNEFKL